MRRRRLKLAREVVAQLSPPVHSAVRGGGVPCSDPTCQVCDTIKPQPGCC